MSEVTDIYLKYEDYENHEQLLRYIEQNQIGYNSTLQGPFGTKRGT